MMDTKTIGHPGFLVSPLIDTLFLGGASIFLFWVMIFLEVGENGLYVKLLALLSLFVNYPHFMSSYQLLYVDHRRDLISHPAYLWASVVVPLLLLFYVAGIFITKDMQLLVWMIQGYFIIVGWHYIKQTFGMLVTTSGLNNVFLSQSERRALLVNLYAVWILVLLALDTGDIDRYFFGVKNLSLALPAVLTSIAYGVFGLSLIVFLSFLYRRARNMQALPPFSSWVALGALYVWMLPALYNPIFILIVPFFHSLQYLLCVFALKRNQWRALEKKGSVSTLLQVHPGAFLATAFILGGAFFVFLPLLLAKLFPVSDASFGIPVYVVVVVLFINIHHYFIDNVLWKKTNPDLKYLFINKKEPLS